MKRKIIIAVLSFSWIVSAILFASIYHYYKMSEITNVSTFHPITWDDHSQGFRESMQCTLLDDELAERKKTLKDEVFSRVFKKTQSSNGFIYFFNDEPNLLASVLEHVQIEKSCCPFLKFDISILPFQQGFALQISGSDEALEMIREFDKGS